jgi:cell division protein FtsL
LVISERKLLLIKSDLTYRAAAKVNTKAKKYATLILGILTVLLLSMLYTYQTTRIMTLGYQFEKVQCNISALQSVNDQLELQLSELQTPQRVEQIAITRLGMQQPQNFIVIPISLRPASSQNTQVATAAPTPPSQGTVASLRSWLTAAIPRLVNKAEASTSTQSGEGTVAQQ